MRLKRYCEECVHFNDYDDGEPGECKYNAPVVADQSKTGGYYGVWPLVDQTDWCSKWEAK